MITTFQSYCSALKALCQAERQLRDTIRETYEAEWPEREHLTALMDVSWSFLLFGQKAQFLTEHPTSQIASFLLL